MINDRKSNFAQYSPAAYPFEGNSSRQNPAVFMIKLFRENKTKEFNKQIPKPIISLRLLSDVALRKDRGAEYSALS